MGAPRSSRGGPNKQGRKAAPGAASRQTKLRSVVAARAPRRAGGGSLEIPAVNADVRTLDNGLEVILCEDPSHPLVSVQVWVRAGSLHEERWVGAGLAHLVEHMLFKGTEKRNAAEISQAIQDKGGYVNAYTSFNRTVYWIDGLAEQADGYLEILSDMVRGSRLDSEELAREMDVVRREMAMDHDDPGSAVQHLMQATAFRQHPLRHPIIGHQQVFDQVTRQDVHDFVRRHYVPNNCFLVIVGAIDAQATFESARRWFGAWERSAYQPVILPTEQAAKGKRENRLSFPTEITRLAVGWPIPGESHADKPALDVLAFLLGSGRSSHLFQELREKRSIAHSVWAGAWSVQECGLFHIEVECDPSDAGAARKGVLEVVEKLQRNGPGTAELDKAVRSSLGSQMRSLMTTRGQAASLGHSWLVAGSLDYARNYLEAIRRLTPAGVKDAAVRHLRPETMNIVTVEPESVDAPAVSTGGKAAAAKIERFALPDGLTLIVGENPRLPLVSMRVQFLAGVAAETDASAGLTRFTAQMLAKGTRKRSAAELATVLESRGGGFQVQGDVHRLLLAADVMRGDETLALDVLADLSLNASLPVNQLEPVKKVQIAGIREEMEDPLTVALRRCRAEVFAGSPYARTALGTEASVRSLQAGQCRQLLREYVNTGNGVISVFGDVRAAEVRRSVERAFGSIPKGKRRVDLCAPATLAYRPGQWDVRMDKEQAVLVVGFPALSLRDPDIHVLNMIDEACSDMGSRLFNRIREELGLAYYVGTQAFAALGAGAFYFYVGTDPRKIELAREEMMRQIKDLAEHGLRADELARAKVTWRSSWLRAQQGNGSLADITGWDELNGNGCRHFEKLPGLVESVTVRDTQRLASRLFGEAKAFVVELLPGKTSSGK